MKTEPDDLKSRFKRLFRSMDFVSRHHALEKSGPEGKRMGDIYQQLGELWEFLALQCRHGEGWRKTREGRMVCKICGTVRNVEESWILLPNNKRKSIGRRAKPNSKETFPNKKQALIVEDSIRFHGAKVKVDVHNAYRSKLFGDNALDIAIAAERLVDVEEDGVECSFSESQICLQLKKEKRGERPPSGAFVFELPKSVLKKLPLLIELDENDELVAVGIFRARNETKNE